MDTGAGRDVVHTFMQDEAVGSLHILPHKQLLQGEGGGQRRCKRDTQPHLQASVTCTLYSSLNGFHTHTRSLAKRSLGTAAAAASSAAINTTRKTMTKGYEHQSVHSRNGSVSCHSRGSIFQVSV